MAKCLVNDDGLHRARFNSFQLQPSHNLPCASARHSGTLKACQMLAKEVNFGGQAGRALAFFPTKCGERVPVIVTET